MRLYAPLLIILNLKGNKEMQITGWEVYPNQWLIQDN